MAESLSPVQGLIAISDRRTIYGLPLGLPAGGGGTKVRASHPPSYRQGGGMKAVLVGSSYNPVDYPPIEEYPIYNLPGGSGAVGFVVSDANIPKNRSAGAARAVVILDASIPKGKNGSGMGLGQVIVVPPP